MKLLSFVILLAVMIKCESCPTNCSCKTSDLTVGCNSRNLTRMPEGIPNQTLKLQLERNSIEEIPAGVFARMENLTHLYLRYNIIRSIDDNTFVGLVKLHLLCLDYNKGLTIATNTFRELKELERLSLIGIGLEDFTGLFVDLTNLTTLKLMRNGAKQLQNGVFSGLYSLQHLRVQHNRIAFVEDRVFEDLHNLIYLRIEDNDIKKIDLKILHDLRGLQTVDLSHNPLTCNCEALELKDFLLNRKQISGIECAEFGGKDLLDIEDFSMCKKRGVFCLTESVQIIDGEPIAFIQNVQSTVQCGVNCDLNQNCNGFVLREDNVCVLWGISHKMLVYNVSAGQQVFETC